MLGTVLMACTSTLPVALAHDVPLLSIAPPAPVTLEHAYQLGSSEQELVQGMVMDPGREHVFLAGYTTGNFEHASAHLGGLDFALACLRVDDGHHVWRKQWGTASADALTDIVHASDSAHLYVSGHSNGDLQTPSSPFQGNRDCYVAKIDASNGAIVWHVQWGHSNADYATSIMLSGDGQHAYTTGTTFDSFGMLDAANNAGRFDFLVTELSTADGAVLWNRRWGTAERDRGVSIALTSDSASAIVAGAAETTSVHSGPRDFALSRVEAADRSLTWAVYWGTGTEAADDLVKVVLTSDGTSAVVTGRTRGSLDGFTNPNPGTWDFVLAKRRLSDGELEWQHQWGTVTDDVLGGMAATSGGAYVIITGTTGAALPDNALTGGIDFVAIKARVSDGAILWQHMYGSTKYERAVGGVTVVLPAAPSPVLLPDDRIVSGGSTSGELEPGQHQGSDDWVVVTLQQRFGYEHVPVALSEEFHVLARQLGTAVNDLLLSVSMSPDGQFAVMGGRSLGEFVPGVRLGGWDFALACIRLADGHVLWRKQWGTAAEDRIVQVEVSHDGHAVFVSGYTHAALPGLTHLGGTDFYMAKLDMDDGSFLWQNQFGSAAGDTSNGLAQSTDGAYVYFLSHGQGTYAAARVGNWDWAVARLSAGSGSIHWFQQWGTTGIDRPKQVLPTPDDLSVLVGGHFNNRARFAVSRLRTSDQSLLWARQWGSSTSDVTSLAVTADQQHVFAAGYTTNSLGGVANSGGFDFVLFKLEMEGGDVVWQQLWGTPAHEYLAGLALSTNNAMVYVVGHSAGEVVAGGQVGADDFVMARFRATTGEQLWVQQWGTVAADQATSTGVLMCGTSLALLPGDRRAVMAGQTQGELARGQQHGGTDYALNLVDFGGLDDPPEVVAPIPDMAVSAGEHFELVVPLGTFQDSVTAEADLIVTGVVEVVSGGRHGGTVEAQVSPGAPGEAALSGVCNLVGDAVLRVTLSCEDEAGGVVELAFNIAVTGTRWRTRAHEMPRYSLTLLLACSCASRVRLVRLVRVVCLPSRQHPAGVLASADADVAGPGPLRGRQPRAGATLHRRRAVAGS